MTTSDAAAAFIVPSAPADLGDDAAWSAYAATLPMPSLAEYAASILDLCGNPYAVEREQSAAGFRRCARRIWQWRCEDDFVDPGAERAMRYAMGQYAKGVRFWDRQAQRWAEDQARRALGMWS